MSEGRKHCLHVGQGCAMSRMRTPVISPGRKKKQLIGSTVSLTYIPIKASVDALFYCGVIINKIFFQDNADTGQLLAAAISTSLAPPRLRTLGETSTSPSSVMSCPATARPGLHTS